MSDLIDSMLPGGRQLESDAHPLVEITFMSQGDRHLVQFINLSGHADTAYFIPIPMANIKVSIKGSFQSARASGSQSVTVNNSNGYVNFTLPKLEEYELVELR